MAKGLKTGGRRPGTPNKANQALIDKCLEKSLDVFDAMVELALEAKGPERFRYLSELAQYLYPKRKAVELSSAQPFKTTFEKLDGSAERYSITPGGDDEDV